MHLSLSLLLLPVLVFASVTPNFVRAPSALARSQTGSVPCQTACVSASDTSGITTIASCPTDPASANTACVCSAAATLSSACLDCFLGLDNISESEFSQACAAGGAGGSGGSTTPTSTASTPSGSASPYCTSVCTSASDQAGEANLQQCADTDLNCLCTTVATLSSSCMSCWLGIAGLTPAQYTTDCAAGGSSSAGSGGSSAGSGGSSAGSGGGSSAGAGGGASSGGSSPTAGNGGSGASNTSSGSGSTPTASTKSDARRVVVGAALGLVLGAMVILA